MATKKFEPRSGWSSDVLSGNTILQVASNDPALAVKLVGEIDKFGELKTRYEESGGDWRRTNLIDFDATQSLRSEIKLVNAGESVLDLIQDRPGTDKQLELMLKGVLNALAFVHEEFERNGEPRGHGNVRPELIFTQKNSADLPYLLGPTLNRIPGPYEPELYPAKAFERQIPTTTGDLYALGMIALRLRMGNHEFTEYFSDIYEIEGEQDYGARWQGWHDNIFAHPSLRRIFQTDDRLSKFVQRLLQRNEDANFESARFALEELTEFTGAMEEFPDIDEPGADEDQEAEFDPFNPVKPVSNKKWLNTGLIALCALVFIGVAILILRPDMVSNVFGSGSGVTVEAIDDELNIQMAATEPVTCNIVTGHGECSVDGLTAKRKRNEEKLIPQLFVSSASIGDDVKRQAPYSFKIDDGPSITVQRDGKLTVSTRGMEVNADSERAIYEVDYTLKVKSKSDQGKVFITLDPPNTEPVANIDNIKIPVDKVEDFKTASLLKNDVDPDVANKPNGWNFEEDLKVKTINGQALSGDSIELQFTGTQSIVRIKTDGSFEFENLPEIVEDDLVVDLTYSVSDVLGAESQITNAKITITKPDWTNSPPIAMADVFKIDLAGDPLPFVFNLMLDNGNGIDTDNDISEEMQSLGIIDEIKVSDINGQTITVGNEIVLANGTVLNVSENGDVSITRGPKDIGYKRPISEGFQYTLTDSFGGSSATTAKIEFEVSVDPNYEELNENWKIKVRNKVPSGNFGAAKSQDLPTVEDCRSFARNMSAGRAKRLTHPGYGFLGEIWVKEYDKLSICILEKNTAGEYQAKLKSDATVQTSVAAYFVEAIKE